MSRNQKKILLFTILFVGVFALMIPHISLAQSSSASTESGGFFGAIFNGFKSAFVWALYYAVFIPVTWIATAAITLFTFAVDPSFISGPTGLLNRVAVYELWKFVRDFFNLFFIFSLLLVAFSTVFQLEKFSIKKMLLGIVLAAMFVNFSFPVSRFMIDTANVPMYFFAKQMMGATGTNSAGEAFEKSALSSTRIERMLLPARDADGSLKTSQTEVTRIIPAIVFMFLFAISLAVLAVMFVIRLTVLIVLVILSPIAFAAAAIPIDDLKGYSKKWWDSFNKYLIFGPAAMFMLLVTVRFMSVISNDVFFEQTESIAGQVAGNQSSAHVVAAQMIFLSIPMIMIWMTISISSYMGIAGAATVEGWGKAVRNWGKRGGFYNNAFTRGIGSGLKERAEKNKVMKWVMPKTWSDKSKETEERTQAWAAGRSSSYASDAHNKKVTESEKKLEEGRKSESDLRKIITEYNANPKSHSKEEAEAAVRLLSKKDGFRDVGDLNAAISAIDQANGGAGTAESAEKRSELIKKVDKSLFKDMNELASALSHLGDDSRAAGQLIEKVDASTLKGSGAEYASLIRSGALATNPNIKTKLDARIKKEGHLKTLIDYDISLGTGTPAERQAAYDKHLSGLTASEFGKVKGIHGDATTPMDNEVHDFVQNQLRSGNWTPQEHIDAYKNLNSAQKAAWRARGLRP